MEREPSQLQNPKMHRCSPGRVSHRDSPSVQVHHHLLCHQGDHLDPGGNRTSSFLPPRQDPGSPQSGAGTEPTHGVHGGGKSTAPRTQLIQKKSAGREKIQGQQQGAGAVGWGAGGLLKHLLQVRALQGGQDHQENPLGPEKQREGQVWAVSSVTTPCPAQHCLRQHLPPPDPGQGQFPRQAPSTRKPFPAHPAHTFIPEAPAVAVACAPAFQRVGVSKKPLLQSPGRPERTVAWPLPLQA